MLLGKSLLLSVLQDQGPELGCATDILVKVCRNLCAKAMSKKQATGNGCQDRRWGERKYGRWMAKCCQGKEKVSRGQQRMDERSGDGGESSKGSCEKESVPNTSGGLVVPRTFPVHRDQVNELLRILDSKKASLEKDLQGPDRSTRPRTKRALVLLARVYDKIEEVGIEMLDVDQDVTDKAETAALKLGKARERHCSVPLVFDSVEGRS